MASNLWLDHASLRVPDLDTAVDLFERVLGRPPARTPGAEGWHSRWHLDRSYLEVSVPRGAAPGWGGSLFFLRFQDLEEMERALREAGIAFRSEPYRGADGGAWDNLELEGPAGVPLPILVRRTAPEEVARDWPPARPEPAPSGAMALGGLHVMVASLEAALEVYGRLLPAARREEAFTDARTGRRRVDLLWGGGRIALHEGAPAGLCGVDVTTASVEASERFLKERGVPFSAAATPGGRRELWLTSALNGLPLALVR